MVKASIDVCIAGKKYSSILSILSDLSSTSTRLPNIWLTCLFLTVKGNHQLIKSHLHLYKISACVPQSIET